MCWGSNYYGQLGLGYDTSKRNTPTAVSGLSNVVQLALGGACARTPTARTHARTAARAPPFRSPLWLVWRLAPCGRPTTLACTAAQRM